jgi:hypothetical protein
MLSFASVPHPQPEVVALVSETLAWHGKSKLDDVFRFRA